MAKIYFEELDLGKMNARQNAQWLTTSVRQLYHERGYHVANVDTNVLDEYRSEAIDANIYIIGTKPDDSTIVGKYNTREMFGLEEPTTLKEFSKMRHFDSFMLSIFRFSFIHELLNHEPTRTAFKAGASCKLAFTLGDKWVEQRTFARFEHPDALFPSCIVRVCSITNVSTNRYKVIHEPQIRDMGNYTMYGLTQHLVAFYKQNLLECLKFTPRELEVTKLGAEGLTRKEIHKQLGGSLQTITVHTKHITAKWKAATKIHVDKFNDVGVYMSELGLL